MKRVLDFSAAENRVCRLLGIRYPLAAAPMSRISGAALVAAVSEAGGIGVLAVNAGMTPGESLSAAERLEREMKRVRALTDKPFGVNLILPESSADREGAAHAESVIDAAAACGASAFFAIGGLSEHFFSRAKASGAALVYRPLTPTLERARTAQDMGADAIVATGYDEGGFLPSRVQGTFTIVPEMADAVKIPVLAAGGINDIRGVRAAFALGAEGVYVGTRFIASHEAAASEAAKRALVEAESESLLYLGPRERTAATPFAKAVREAQALSPAAAAALREGIDAYTEGMVKGDLKRGVVCVNSGAGLVTSIRPAGEIVRELMADFD